MEAHISVLIGLSAWNSSLWMIPPIWIKRVTECLIVPALLDPSTLLTVRGFSSFFRGILFLCAKP